ncbi:kinesin motor catalytic domain protein (macronuclear) [Tetrahymena thermophila SB210]|uniref:Kinesin motor catalytic domain protein n=1 Tax=Tetrahymena thermophila (strain SB210) TaxID=312017 RepID=Q22HC8_TETTS|nr:kinesin motor catalytic domain protein [Tetrahymena thermophila SB210]EAR84773.4 kinesin motor catalytic domain protein [Tetrahymena thermophila SB210]|eukprot:XP_001032436.4 kinesin motor catalytic domain protein [Tetrahymena thermophila SB210]
MTDSVSVTSMSEDERDIQPIKKIKKNPKKDEMKVFLRIRPQDNLDQRGPIGVNEQERCIMGISNDEYLNQKIEEFRGLKFNKIFKEDCSQDEFYNDVIAPILPDIFNSKKSSLIFAYGVTNSGKTHSILGSRKYNQNGDGILPRVLFFLVEAKKLIKQQIQQKVDFNDDGIFSENKITIDGITIDLKNFIFHSHNHHHKLQDINILFENFEIYNEDIFDLQTVQVQSQPQSLQLNNTFHNTLSQQLNTDHKKEKRSASKRNTAQKNKLKIKEKFNKKIYIKDLITNEVDSFEQINWLIKNAIENRQVRNNNVNQNSSRSQCCFKIRVKFTYCNSLYSQIEEEASLLILDLAGAERAKKTNNTGSKMTESCHINKTLLCLGNCIRSLRNGDENIPYRESKLTRILNEYFVDQNNVLMIVHIHPGISYTEENINVLKYAAIGLEAKLKAAATIYEGSSKHSFLLMDSAQKSMRNDKSIISNISYDARSNYRDYQSIDQDQFFPQIDNFANNTNYIRTNYFTQSDQKSNKGGIRNIHQNDYYQIQNSDGQLILDQAMNQEMAKTLEEEKKSLEEKYKKEMEIKEIIQQQKRAIENYDLQFENMINEENNKLKLGQSLLNIFKVPDQIMYGELTEDQVNQDYLEQIKRFSDNQLNSSNNSQREIIRISSQKFKNSSNKNIDKTQEKYQQTGGGYQDNQQTFGKTPYQSQELVERKNEIIDQVNKEQESDHKFYIRDKNSTHSLRLNEEDMKLISQQNKKYSFDSQNSILNYKENIQIASNLYRDASSKYQQDEMFSSKSNSINQKQINFSQASIQNNHKERNSQNSLSDLQIHQIRKNQQSTSNQKEMIDEQSNLFSQKLSQGDSSMIKNSKQMEVELLKPDQERKVDMENELEQFSKDKPSAKKSSLKVKGVDVDKYIQEVYDSSAKKVNSEIIDDSSERLLESPKIFEEKDSESEHNKTAPNSINSATNLDYFKRSPSLDILSVSQQLLQLKQQQDQERENLQQCLNNDEEEIKQYLELDLDENNLKQQILSQSQKLMQLIKDKEQEIEYQRQQFNIQQDNKNKEDQRKMKVFEEWIQQIQQELKIQSRFLEQKEVILSQQQLELASLQANLQEKYRIQQQQIQENLLASETMKEQILKQEQKLREETERIVNLQQKVEEEMQMLVKEKTLLGIQKSKSDEIKSKTATPYKFSKSKNQMDVDYPIALQDHHVNFDLSNLSQSKQAMEEEIAKQSSAPRKLSGSYYPGHEPHSQGSSKQRKNCEKSYAEKQIQTSAIRPAPRNNQNNQQNHSDVSVYTYYTYSEAESVNPILMNNSQGSQQQNSAPNSQNSKENNLKSKYKNTSNLSQQKNKIQFSPQKENQSLLLNSSLKLCQQIQNQNNQVSQSKSLECNEEEQSKKYFDKKPIESDLQKLEQKNSNKILKEKQNEMVDENDQVKINKLQNESEQNENQEGQEKRRQRGRKKVGQKQKKATSKERQENSSVDLDSTSKESESEDQEDLTNEEQLRQILDGIDQQTTKNNKKRGRKPKQRDSLSSNKSRNSLSSVDSEASSRGQKKQTKQGQSSIEKDRIICINENEQNVKISKDNNKRSASNSSDSRNAKKKNKNKYKK